MHPGAVLKTTRGDNGPEFISKSPDLWALGHSVQLDFSRPGNPIMILPGHATSANTFVGDLGCVSTNQKPKAFAKPSHSPRFPIGWNPGLSDNGGFVVDRDLQSHFRDDVPLGTGRTRCPK